MNFLHPSKLACLACRSIFVSAFSWLLLRVSINSELLLVKHQHSLLTATKSFLPSLIKNLWLLPPLLCFHVGLLKPPVDTDGSGEEEEEIDIENEEVESDDHNHAEIQQEAVRITNEMTWSVNDLVVCKYNDKWYPGIIISIHHCHNKKYGCFSVQK